MPLFLFELIVSESIGHQHWFSPRWDQQIAFNMSAKVEYCQQPGLLTCPKCGRQDRSGVRRRGSISSPSLL